MTRCDEGVSAINGIREKYLSLIVASGIFGSTGTAREGPHSDLEIMTITTQAIPDEFTLQPQDSLKHAEYRRCLFFRTQEEMQRIVQKINAEWPILVTSYVEIHSTYDPQGIFAKNKETISQIPRANFDQAVKRTAGHAFEYFGKIQNSYLHNPAKCLTSARKFMELIAKTLALHNRAYFIDGNDSIREASNLPNIPKTYSALAPIVANFSSIDAREIQNTSALLWTDFLQFLKLE